MKRFASVVLLLMLPAVMGLRPVAEGKSGFEVRRAETEPAADLREVKLEGHPKIYVHDTADLVNDDVESARLVPAEARGRYATIDVTLTDEGARKARELSEEHANKPVAIMVNGRVVASARVITKFGKRFKIANIPKDDAAEIIDVLDERRPR